MHSTSSGASPDDAERPELVSYLHGRMIEEADAAVKASSMEATIIHVTLATAYAKRLCDHSGWSAVSHDKHWIDHNRVW